MAPLAKGIILLLNRQGSGGEPGHLKCADTSLFGRVSTVEVMGGVGLRDQCICERNVPLLFSLQEMFLSVLLITFSKTLPYGAQNFE